MSKHHVPSHLAEMVALQSAYATLLKRTRTIVDAAQDRPALHVATLRREHMRREHERREREALAKRHALRV